MLKTFALFLFALLLSSCDTQTKNDETNHSQAFNFAFLTDVHMNANNMEVSTIGLKKALEHAKSQNIDFVIFGGDLVDLDALHPSDSLKANSLMTRFKSIVDSAGIKTYFTLGNHDRYYTFNNQTDTAGYKLFEKKLGKTYFSFDHKGTHFVILNSIQINDSTRNYSVGSEQLEWLKADLSKISRETPLVVATHVPFQSLYYPVVEGVVKNVDMLSNFKEVWDILLNYNLKLILQGHQHLHEELLVNKTNFVTGGAVSAAWWGGPLLDTEEGYMLVTINNNQDFSWQYVDYGWEVEKENK